MGLARRMAVTLPAGPRVEKTAERVQWAEDNGYADAWFGDGGAPDSLTTAASLGAVGRTLRIGVAVTPVYTRTPAVLAATADALGQILPGRFVLGLGSSSQTMMEGWHGVAFEKPLTRVKETALLVRSLLAGEKSDFDGVTLRSRGYRQHALADAPPIYLGALRPKMIEMAAEVGDGVIFNLWPRSALPRMLAHVRAGAERAGKDWRDVEVVNRAMVLVTDDVAAGRDLFRAAFGPYYATPVYNAFLGWAGHPEAAAAVADGFARRDRAATARALDDALIDEIAVIGDEEACRARLRADAEAGVHTQIVSPLARPGSPEARRTFEAFRGDVFSLG
jgi:probable F420-dependent oxidoreductase